MARRDPHQVQLNGWKEIAEFFGKSPRTVQRWEAELGLPVRRLKTPAGEIVFALREELTSWRDGRTETPPDVVDEADAGVGRPDVSPVTADSTAQHRHRVVRWTAILLMLLAVSGLLWSRGTFFRSSASTSVATAEFRGSTIVARDFAGGELWTYQFPHALWTRPRDPNAPFTFTPGDPPLVADFDRDGQAEVLAIVTYGDPDREHSEQQLFCLSSTGTLKWTYLPDPSYSFRGRHAGPTGWEFLDVLVADGTAEPAVFVSLGATPWWPSVVVRIDAHGASEVRYVSSGSVYAIEQVKGPTGWHLLAGGVNNDYNAAAIAIIPERGPTAVSPQKEGSQYQCLDCPSGRPLAFLTFPRTDVNVEEGHQPYNKVWDFRRNGSQLDVVTVESINHSAFCFYTLTPALDPVRLTLSDSPAHELLERQRRLDHKEADCPLRRNGALVRKWTPAAGWQDMNVPVTPK